MADVHGVVVVDKPRGPTSHDIVSRMRKALKTRRVGHAGTLDPMATGVLVIAVGEGTKLVPYLTAADKEYEAELKLGSATDTLDAQGNVTETASVPRLDMEAVRQAAEPFLGAHMQRAPKVSAIKVDGQRLHERARRGDDFEAPLREVVLHHVEILEVQAEAIRFRLRAAKGFYVRSFGRDLAQALGTVGHLQELRRHASGRFTLEDAVEIGAEPMGLLEAARRVLPVVEVADDVATDAFHGRPIAAARVPSDAEVVAFSHRESLLAIARREADELRIQRGFRA